LASHYMFSAVAKHFVILIQNRTKEGLNTISFHRLMLPSALSMPPMKWLYTFITFGCWTWNMFFTFWE
jgi:hypothetical protein